MEDAGPISIGLRALEKRHSPRETIKIQKEIPFSRLNRTVNGISTRFNSAKRQLTKMPATFSLIDTETFRQRTN